VIELSFQGDGVAWSRDIYCDRLALDSGGNLLFASIITDAMQFKAIRGAVCTNKTITITAPGVEVAKPGGKALPPESIQKHLKGYNGFTHKLPFRKVHAFLVAKQPGLMLAASEAHLWRELTGDTYTTPLLREWMPAVIPYLLANDLLVPAYCYNCEVAVLTATDKNLDECVGYGLRFGKMSIPAKTA
jgi:hypothetical protein